ncbi:MAG: glycosyltransferase family 4 protein [Oligoflexales bacterium]|nr:glycosyltransferase family 4 protein [Oligoflexales bacterium]
MKKKLLISTLSPTNYGGILSMMTSAYQISSQSYDTTIAYRTDTRLAKNRFINWLKRLFLSTYEHRVFRGMRCVGVVSGLGIHHSLSYVDTNKNWSNLLDNYESYFCVGGSAHSALPLLKNNKSYSIWIATPYLDDRIDRKGRLKGLRKIIEILFSYLAINQEKRVLRNARKILALSRYTKQKIHTYYSIPLDRIEVVPFPINIDVFRPNFAKRDNNSKRLIFTGRINDPRKNTPMLLKSFSSILKSLPNTYLTIIGELPSARIKKLASDLNITRNIEFIDRLDREELVNYYQSSHLFLLPSNQEGLCISALEALACGLPVISTKCGGPEEFVTKKNGKLVEINNDSQFAKSVIEIVSNDKLLTDMSLESRSLAEQKYSVEKISKKFLKYI